MSAATQLKEDLASATMQRDRDELRALFSTAQDRSPTGFPRSATIRWLISRAGAQTLISTLLAAAMTRALWRPLFGRLLAAGVAESLRAWNRERIT